MLMQIMKMQTVKNDDDLKSLAAFEYYQTFGEDTKDENRIKDEGEEGEQRDDRQAVL